jgi:mannose-1-phosphate guanylyltransferase
MKERIALTIDRDLLTKLDSMVDETTVRNRSHAVELILSKHLGFKELKHAVILCGGEGTRLRPITYAIPTPLVPLHGKPIIAHLFDLLRKYDVRNVVLSIGHKKDKIKHEIGDGRKYGLNVTFTEEDAPLGTAGPLANLKDVLKSSFIVSNGDELKNIDIMEMFENHRKSGALVTIALTTVSDPSQYGVAKLDGSRIVEFVEKPKAEEAPSNLINAGFYIIEPEVLSMIKPGFSMLERDIFPKLAEQGRLYGFPFSGQWFDTGNMERYERAIKEWKDIE